MYMHYKQTCACKHVGMFHDAGMHASMHACSMYVSGHVCMHELLMFGWWYVCMCVHGCECAMIQVHELCRCVCGSILLCMSVCLQACKYTYVGM